MSLLARLLVPLLALAACAAPEGPPADAQVQVASVSNPRLRVPRSGTYAWMQGSRIVRDERVHGQLAEILLNEVEAGLGRRGYSRVQLGEPDLLIGVLAGLAGSIQDADLNAAYDLDSTWLPEGVSERDYAPGSVVLDVVDARTHRSLWRGVVHGAAKFERSDEERRERVRAVVEALLSSFDRVR
jgi:hypothetical protein